MNGVAGCEASSGEGSSGISGSSGSLLDRVRAQDASAWRQLVDLYGPLIGYWCRRSGLQTADVADVTQAVFMAVARQLPDFRRSNSLDETNPIAADVNSNSEARGRRSGMFRGWLYVVTRRKLIDWRRACRPDQAQGGSTAAKRLHEQIDPIDSRNEHSGEAVSFGAASFESECQADEELSRVWDGVVSRGLEQIRHEFQSQTWTAFWRTVVDGQTTSVVAAELDLSQASVRQAKSRILRRLRQQLGDL